jgi:RNA polymerase sigma factor (sigma-70 family)
MKLIRLPKDELSTETDSDEDLLLVIAKNDHPSKSEAFHFFYTRYSDYLWKVCSIVCRSHPQASELTKDTFQQTMTKVYLNAHSYDKSISSVKTWISKIARNEFLNCLKQNKSVLSLFDDIKDINIDEITYDDTPLDTEDIKTSQIEVALLNLSEKERMILTTYMMYYDEENPDKHLPDREINDLCTYFNTTPNNIRQIKSRAMKKVKTLLSNQS